MNMLALQTPCPAEQLKDKERENSKAQLRRWINAGLISGSAKASVVPFVDVCACTHKHTHLHTFLWTGGQIVAQHPQGSNRGILSFSSSWRRLTRFKDKGWRKGQKQPGTLPSSLADSHTAHWAGYCIGQSPNKPFSKQVRIQSWRDSHWRLMFTGSNCPHNELDQTCNLTPNFGNDLQHPSQRFAFTGSCFCGDKAVAIHSKLTFLV